MNKLSIAIFLSLSIAAMPHLGFSSDIEMIFYSAAGVIIAALIHLSRTGKNVVADKEKMLTVDDIEALNIEPNKVDAKKVAEEDAKEDESRD